MVIRYGECKDIGILYAPTTTSEQGLIPRDAKSKALRIRDTQ